MAEPALVRRTPRARSRDRLQHDKLQSAADHLGRCCPYERRQVDVRVCAAWGDIAGAETRCVDEVEADGQRRAGGLPHGLSGFCRRTRHYGGSLQPEGQRSGDGSDMGRSEKPSCRHSTVQTTPSAGQPLLHAGTDLRGVLVRGVQGCNASVAIGQHSMHRRLTFPGNFTALLRRGPVRRRGYASGRKTRTVYHSYRHQSDRVPRLVSDGFPDAYGCMWQRPKRVHAV